MREHLSACSLNHGHNCCDCYPERIATLKRENRGLIKKSIAKEEHIHMLMDRIDALLTAEEVKG